MTAKGVHLSTDFSGTTKRFATTYVGVILPDELIVFLKEATDIARQCIGIVQRLRIAGKRKLPARS